MWSIAEITESVEEQQEIVCDRIMGQYLGCAFPDPWM